jgi:hypothetical protein
MIFHSDMQSSAASLGLVNNHVSTGMNPAVGQCFAADVVQNHGSTGASPAVATSNEQVHHPHIKDAPHPDPRLFQTSRRTR